MGRTIHEGDPYAAKGRAAIFKPSICMLPPSPLFSLATSSVEGVNTFNTAFSVFRGVGIKAPGPSVDLDGSAGEWVCVETQSFPRQSAVSCGTVPAAPSKRQRCTVAHDWLHRSTLSSLADGHNGEPLEGIAWLMQPWAPSSKRQRNDQSQTIDSGIWSQTLWDVCEQVHTSIQKAEWACPGVKCPTS